MKKISNGMAIITKDDDLLEIISGSVRCFYLEDLQIELNIFYNQIYITYIADAQKSGKLCREYSYSINGYDNNAKVFICEVCNKYGRTINHLIKALRLDLFENITSYQRDIKSINVFSPFVKCKAIKKPTKWRKSHIIKAIFSGQIKSSKCTGYYTDDYAYDAAVNFGIGNEINLFDLAKELIQSNSKGLGFWQDAENENLINIANYTFDYKQVIFEA